MAERSDVPSSASTPSSIRSLGDEPPKRTTTADSVEVVLHEIGESVAASLARIQAELAFYPNSFGSFAVDEIELSMPVSTRIDELGQVMVTVITTQPAAPASSAVAAPSPTSQLRILVRPVLGVPAVPPRVAKHPVEVLGEIGADLLEKLQARRIFSVDDLQRVARPVAGRDELRALGFGARLDETLDRAVLISIAELPEQVGLALLKTTAPNPLAFVRANSDALAHDLSERLGKPIAASSVQQWQSIVAGVIDVPVPLNRGEEVPTSVPITVTFGAESVGGNISIAIKNTGGKPLINLRIVSISHIVADAPNVIVWDQGQVGNPGMTLPWPMGNLAAGEVTGRNFGFKATAGSVEVPFSFTLRFQADSFAAFNVTVHVARAR